MREVRGEREIGRDNDGDKKCETGGSASIGRLHA